MKSSSIGRIAAVFGAMAILVFGQTAFAADDSRGAYWEKEFAAQMNDSDLASLQAQATRWESELTARPNDPVVQTRLGIVYHNLSRILAIKGTKGNAVKAFEYLEAASKSNAEDGLLAVALSYQGSAASLKAGEEANLDKKLAYVKQGFELLDKAVERYGELSLLPRFLRGHVALAVPEFLKKIDVAGEDFAALHRVALARPNRVAAPMFAQIELQLGNYSKKKKDMTNAIESWKKALSLDPDKKGAGKEASAQLQKYAE